MDQRALGRLGEDAAAEMMARDGFQILERNWSCRIGELDLIAQRGRILIFVEVKTRQSLKFGAPAEAITGDKQRKIRRLADCYIKEKKLEGMQARFDVIEVYLHHIVRAF